MRATLGLKADEIRTAIKEYVERNGWKVSGAVRLDAYEETDMRGEGAGFVVSACVEVEPVQPSTIGYTR